MLTYQCNKHDPVINSNPPDDEMATVEAEENKESGY